MKVLVMNEIFSTVYLSKARFKSSFQSPEVRIRISHTPSSFTPTKFHYFFSGYTKIFSLNRSAALETIKFRPSISTRHSSVQVNS